MSARHHKRASRRPAQPRGVKVDIEGMRAVKVGGERFRWDDIYSALFSLPFSLFILTYVTIYLAVNTFFALLFMLQPGAVAEARPWSFRDNFFFSVETFATVGYGVMAPHTLYGHVIATSEIITGIFFAAGLTGLIFSRFSRPRARLLFSDVMVVGRHRGKPALMMRVASRRNRAIGDVSARLTLLYLDTSDEQRSRRFIDLPLVRSSAPLLSLSWTLIHVIHSDGLIARLAELIEQDQNLIIVASVGGFDEAIAANVSARKFYRAEDIRFDHAFVDIISQADDGRVRLDLTRIHDAEPLRDAAAGAA